MNMMSLTIGVNVCVSEGDIDLPSKAGEVVIEILKEPFHFHSFPAVFLYMM